MEEAFGQEAIDISIFEKDKLLNSDVIKDYYSKIGLEKLLVYPHKTAANHKISQNYFEKIRHLMLKQ